MRPCDPDIDLLLARERAELLSRDCQSDAVTRPRQRRRRRLARRVVLGGVRLVRAVPRALGAAPE